ncbi:MAG: MarC family protein [Candidatus Pacebacteria bacterium]|nr:MarC family protein [Candidatus Paceibacterota bacterium]
MLYFIQIFFAVFGVMDPLGNVPFFLAFASPLDKAGKRKFARSAILYAGSILIVFMFLGNGILNLFQISMDSFRIAGGIALLLIGIKILFGLDFKQEDREHKHEEEPSIMPLATPLIAGPGTISLVIIFAKEYGYMLTLAGVLSNLLLNYIIFLLAPYILKIFGKKEIMVFANMMGLILMAIGVEFIRVALMH